MENNERPKNGHLPNEEVPEFDPISTIMKPAANQKTDPADSEPPSWFGLAEDQFIPKDAIHSDGMTFGNIDDLDSGRYDGHEDEGLENKENKENEYDQYMGLGW